MRAGSLEIIVRIECRDERVAEALEQVLLPDNRYFPKDQVFESRRVRSNLEFKVRSPRLKPAIGTVNSLVGDAKLFEETWLGSGAR